MPGDYSGGATVDISRNLNVQTYSGTLLPSLRANNSGKTLTLIGGGAVNGFIECRDGGILICSIDVLGSVSARVDGSKLVLRDCYVEANSAQGAIQLYDVFGGFDFQMRNCRIRAIGVDAPAVYVQSTVGSSTFILENSILEANGTGESIEATSAVTMDIANVFANSAVNSNVTQRISTVSVNSNVRAL